ncbi:Nup85 nucleoporin-domain-containing protein [Amanita rubescens]|nr:Nup85 nucleoporin-domain-containing protein [Amanita rubescens]
MTGKSHLNLAPPLVDSGQSESLVKSGQAICASLSPHDNSLAVYVTREPGQVGHPRSARKEEQPVYFSCFDEPPTHERRLFITDTSIIYAALQNVLKTGRTKEPEWMQSEQTVNIVRKLAIDYVNFIKECWVHASQAAPRPDVRLQFSGDHYRKLYTCFSLFVVLYLPEPGYEDAPVGDDLMEWLNTHFIEPSTEEGVHLSALECPWEDETFWPYLTRTVLRGLSKASLFFLDVLKRHPLDDLQQIVETLGTLINTQPRLQTFTAERDFVLALNKWRNQVKALRIEMDRVPEAKRFDGFENWWDHFSDVVAILEGRADIIQRVCEELGADWKEASAAWGVFVDARLRRQDLSEISSQVMDEMPGDPTNLEDMLHAALLSAQPEQALQYAYELDPWLSAHMADIMDALGTIPRNSDDSGVTTRDQYVLAYAEYLHSDPGFVADDHVGKGMADQILLRVPLKLREQNDSDRIREGDIVGVLKDVNETCFQHQREAVRRTICRIAAQTLVQDKDYGLAVSYCTSAEDWSGLGRIVDQVLKEYVTNGTEKFAKYASTIAPTVQQLRTQNLLFAVRYAQFHEFLNQGNLADAAQELISIFYDDLAPKSWWAVLLNDAIELLSNDQVMLFSATAVNEFTRKVEEVVTRTSYGDVDYLGTLMQCMKGGEKEALNRLKLVRAALAKYYARCTIANVG